MLCPTRTSGQVYDWVQTHSQTPTRAGPIKSQLRQNSNEIQTFSAVREASLILSAAGWCRLKDMINVPLSKNADLLHEFGDWNFPHSNCVQHTILKNWACFGFFFYTQHIFWIGAYNRLCGNLTIRRGAYNAAELIIIWTRWSRSGQVPAHIKILTTPAHRCRVGSSAHASTTTQSQASALIGYMGVKGTELSVWPSWYGPVGEGHVSTNARVRIEAIEYGCILLKRICGSRPKRVLNHKFFSEVECSSTVCCMSWYRRFS